MLKRLKQSVEDHPAAEASPRSTSDRRGGQVIVALSALSAFFLIAALAGALGVLPFGDRDEPAKRDEPRAALPPEWRDLRPLRPLFPEGEGSGVASDRARDRSRPRPARGPVTNLLPRAARPRAASRPRLRVGPPRRARPLAAAAPRPRPVPRLVPARALGLDLRVRLPSLVGLVDLDVTRLFDFLFAGGGLALDIDFDLGFELPDIDLLPGFELSPIDIPVDPPLPVDVPDLPRPTRPLPPAQPLVSTDAPPVRLPRVGRPLGAATLGTPPGTAARTAETKVASEAEASPASSVLPGVEPRLRRRLSRTARPSSDAARRRSAPGSESGDRARRPSEREGERSGDSAEEIASSGSATPERRSASDGPLEVPAEVRAGSRSSRDRRDAGRAAGDRATECQRPPRDREDGEDDHQGCEQGERDSERRQKREDDQERREDDDRGREDDARGREEDDARTDRRGG